MWFAGAAIQTEEQKLPRLFQNDSGSRPSGEADGKGKTIAPTAGGLSGLSADHSLSPIPWSRFQSKSKK